MWASEPPCRASSRASSQEDSCVVEAFHRDSLKNGAIGAGVVFDNNELLKLFERFRMIQYEDAEDKSDFGKGTNRVVRLVAQKQ